MDSNGEIRYGYLVFLLPNPRHFPFLSLNSPMAELAASSFPPCKLKLKLKQEWQHYHHQFNCHALTLTRRSNSSPPFLLVRSQMTMKPATYSSRISTDMPLYESPGVIPFCSFVIFLCGISVLIDFRVVCALCRPLLISTWMINLEFLKQFSRTNEEATRLMRFGFFLN